MTRAVTNATWARLDAALESHPYLVILAVRRLCIRHELGSDKPYPWRASSVLLTKLHGGMRDILEHTLRSLSGKMTDADLRIVASRFDRRTRTAIDRMWAL